MESIDTKVINVIGDKIKPVANIFDSDNEYYSKDEVFNVNGNSQHSLADKVTPTSKKRKYVSSEEQSVFIEKIELEKEVSAQNLINMKKKEILVDLLIRQIQASLGQDYLFNMRDSTLLSETYSVLEDTK